MCGSCFCDASLGNRVRGIDFAKSSSFVFFLLFCLFFNFYVFEKINNTKEKAQLSRDRSDPMHSWVPSYKTNKVAVVNNVSANSSVHTWQFKQKKLTAVVVTNLYIIKNWITKILGLKAKFIRSVVTKLVPRNIWNMKL